MLNSIESCQKIFTNFEKISSLLRQTFRVYVNGMSCKCLKFLRCVGSGVSQRTSKQVEFLFRFFLRLRVKIFKKYWYFLINSPSSWTMFLKLWTRYANWPQKATGCFFSRSKSPFYPQTLLWCATVLHRTNFPNLLFQLTDFLVLLYLLLLSSYLHQQKSKFSGRLSLNILIIFCASFFTFFAQAWSASWRRNMNDWRDN